jgi:hypothetical protein
VRPIPSKVPGVRIFSSDPDEKPGRCVREFVFKPLRNGGIMKVPDPAVGDQDRSSDFP